MLDQWRMRYLYSMSSDVVMCQWKLPFLLTQSIQWRVLDGFFRHAFFSLAPEMYCVVFWILWAEKPTTHAQTAGNDEIDEFRAARQKYKEQSAVKLKKGSDREAETLKMLAAFQSKIASAKKLSEFVSGANDESDDKGSDKEKEEDSGDDDADDFSWYGNFLCQIILSYHMFFSTI
jgi:hypothetical protein